jgi:U3 small nucleolar RNA-associated protein MPP10
MLVALTLLQYLRQTAGVEKADEVDEKRNEIAVMFKKLCYKLDALSNFHYTPKPVRLSLFSSHFL